MRVCPWSAVAVARDPRRPRGRCVASPCVRYATPPRTSGLREHDESRERDGEPRVARNDPIALPSLRSRARGALYSIRYAYFGWRVSSRTLMINARRNGPGDGPARSRFDSVSRRRVRVLGAARPRGWPPPRADPRRACACALANRTRSRSYFIACRGRGAGGVT